MAADHMIVLRIVSDALGLPTIHDGQYLVDADIEDGMVADIVSSPSLTQAKKFANPAEAIEYWRRQSSNPPLRPDGKPNRPLTAYTAETINVPG